MKYKNEINLFDIVESAINIDDDVPVNTHGTVVEKYANGYIVEFFVNEKSYVKGISGNKIRKR